MYSINRIIIVCVLTGIIHAIDTLSYSVRIAGVRTQRLAIAFSLFNIIVLGSRTANMIQAPLVGSMADLAIKANDLTVLNHSFRLIIISATLGSILGALLIPTFIHLFVGWIHQLEDKGSVAKMVFGSFSLYTVTKTKARVSTRPLKNLKSYTRTDLPKSFLLLKIIITAIYTVGVLSSIYAGALIPQFRLTASQLSGIINGFATILLAVVIDPKTAIITDQVLQGKRKKTDVNSMVVYLVGGKILGTILGQLLFVPAAWLVVFFTQLIAG